MTSENNTYTLDRVVRLVISTILIIGILYLIRYLSPVLVPFFIALFIVYLINPLVQFIQDKLRLKKRIFAVLITFLIIAAIIAMITTWLIPLFVKEMVRMTQLIKSYIQVAGYKNFLPGDLDLYLKDFLEEHQVEAFFNPENAMALIQKSFFHLKTFLSGSVQVLSSLLGALVITLYAIFLLLDFDKIEKSWPSFVPEKYRTVATHIVDDLKDGMNTYFRMQGLIALLVGIMLSIGFSIIGLPLAIMMGMAIGLLNLVPYLQLVGLIPAFLLALLKALDTGNTFWHEAFLVLIVVSIVQMIQDLVLTPRIMGKAYGLNPAVILLSLSIWGSLLGFVGLLLALPLTTILTSYYKRFVLNHETFISHTHSSPTDKKSVDRKEEDHSS